MPPSHSNSQTLIEKKLASGIINDPEIKALIKAGKSNTPEFKSKILSKTVQVIKSDPTIQADFAKKMFNADKFGRTLNQNEQIRLLNFILNKP
jgi:hypothetical protein